MKDTWKVCLYTDDHITAESSDVDLKLISNWLLTNCYVNADRIVVSSDPCLCNWSCWGFNDVEQEKVSCWLTFYIRNSFVLRLSLHGGFDESKKALLISSAFRWSLSNCGMACTRHLVATNRHWRIKCSFVRLPKRWNTSLSAFESHGREPRIDICIFAHTVFMYPVFLIFFFFYHKSITHCVLLRRKTLTFLLNMTS